MEYFLLVDIFSPQNLIYYPYVIFPISFIFAGTGSRNLAASIFTYYLFNKSSYRKNFVENTNSTGHSNYSKFTNKYDIHATCGPLLLVEYLRYDGSAMVRFDTARGSPNG